jgi:carbon-monoxide dehydrogenase medium subunit
VLLIHDAMVTLGSHRGERQLALGDFYVDMYATALEPDELLVEVKFFALPAGMKSAYVRLHRYQRPTLGVAAATRIENDTVQEARLAVGCVGPTAQRLPDLEKKLIGAKLGDARRIIADAKNYLRDLLKPVDDLLGSADYKLYMTGVLLGDSVEQSAGSNVRNHAA